mgnify:CR=1 FL=1
MTRVGHDQGLDYNMHDACQKSQPEIAFLNSMTSFAFQEFKEFCGQFFS